MKVLTDAKAIREAQETLQESLTDADIVEEVAIGFPGDYIPDKLIHWHADDGFWYAFGKARGRLARKATKTKKGRKAKPPHFWNAFGIEHPHAGKRSKSLTVEINPATSGIDRQLGGIFVEDRNGRVFLAHTGKIGGGAPGVGKSAFQEWYGDGDWVTVDWDGRETDVIRVAFVDDRSFRRDVGAFVHDVAKFKLLVKRRRERTEAKKTKGKKKAAKTGAKKTKPESDEVKIKNRFNVGPSSTKGFLLNKYVQPTNHHHTVVKALRKRLLAYKTATPKQTDCVIHKGNTATHIFEIKTSSDTTAVFAAVGQLYCYATQLKVGEDAKRIAVLPVPKKTKRRTEIERILPEMNIGIVWYRRAGVRVSFEKLSDYVFLREG